MARPQKLRILTSSLLAILMIALTGCPPNETDQQRTERERKTRDEAAKTVANAKPEIQEAGRELGKAADEAAREALAFAQGVKEGWIRGGHHIINLNSASESELMDLPGITRAEALRIIRSRPYSDKKDLVTKHIVPETEYEKIRDIVTVN